MGFTFHGSSSSSKAGVSYRPKTRASFGRARLRPAEAALAFGEEEDRKASKRVSAKISVSFIGGDESA